MPTRIMTVDDDIDILELVSETLALEGYEVIQALSGEEALEKLEREHVDLILLDIMMPGMGGFEACDKIKSNKEISHIPILMLTAKHDSEYHLDAITVDADGYITKPFDSDYLLKKVSEHLEIANIGNAPD